MDRTPTIGPTPPKHQQLLKRYTHKEGTDWIYDSLIDSVGNSMSQTLVYTV